MKRLITTFVGMICSVAALERPAKADVLFTGASTYAGRPTGNFPANFAPKMAGGTGTFTDTTSLVDDVSLGFRLTRGSWEYLTAAGGGDAGKAISLTFQAMRPFVAIGQNRNALVLAFDVDFFPAGSTGGRYNFTDTWDVLTGLMTIATQSGDISGTASHRPPTAVGNPFNLPAGIIPWGTPGQTTINLVMTGSISFTVANNDAGNSVYRFTFPDSAEAQTFGVPEPATLMLLGTGMLALLAYQRGTRRDK